MLKQMAFMFILISVALIIPGCDSVEKKTKQAEILQSYSQSFVAACTGKLSMNVTFTGDIAKPMQATMSCDEMNKDHDFFKSLSVEEIAIIKKQIKDLN